MAIPQKYPLLTLLKLEQANAAYLRRMLEETAKTVEKQLKALDKGGVSSEVTRMQLEAQRASIKGYLKQDFNKVEDVVRLGQKEAAAAASRVVSRYEQLLQGMVMTPQMMKQIADSEALRAANGIEAAMRRMEKTSFVPLAKQVYMTEKLASGWVDDQINQALIKGSTWKELANAISGSINPNVPGGVSYAAERLARTEINNAFHASAAKRFQESNLTEAVEWHLSTSHPEGDICDSLAADGPYDPEKIPRKPHPHCYCYITPVLPEEEEFFNNLFNGKYDEDGWGEQAAENLGDVTGMARPNAWSKPASAPKPKNFTEDEADWARYYTGNGYQVFNDTLRGSVAPGFYSNAQEGIDNITAMLMRQTTDETMLVSRAVSKDVFGLKHPEDVEGLVGQTFHEKGFMSTGMANEAQDATDLTKSIWMKDINMRVTIPKGTPGADITQFSTFKNESEFLLPPGVEFTITKFEVSEDYRIWIDVVVNGVKP